MWGFMDGFSTAMRYLPVILRVAPDVPVVVTALGPTLKEVEKATPQIVEALQAIVPVAHALDKAATDLLPIFRRWAVIAKAANTP